MTNHPNRSPDGSSSARNPSPREIRKARENAGLTQDAAAALVLSARRAWQDWELGARRMHPALWELFQIKIKGHAHIEVMGKWLEEETAGKVHDETKGAILRALRDDR